MSANGSIKRDASGKWFFIVDVTSADGKRKQLRNRGFVTKKAAGEAMAIVVADQSRGLFVRPVKGTAGIFLMDTWLPTKSRSLRPGTAFDYRKLLTHYVVPHIGHLELSKIDGGTVNALYELLLTNGRTGGSHRMGGLAPKTVRNVHGVLHKAFSDAVKLKRIAVNPCDAADQLRADTPEMKTWTREQIRQFMAHVATDRHVGIWQLLLTTGMRRGEILGLRWSDIDLGSNRLTIRSTTTQVGGQSLKGAPKTTDSSRTIAVDTGTAARLKAWKKLQTEERMLMGAGWCDSAGCLSRSLMAQPCHRRSCPNDSRHWAPQRVCR